MGGHPPGSPTVAEEEEEDYGYNLFSERRREGKQKRGFMSQSLYTVHFKCRNMLRCTLADTIYFNDWRIASGGGCGNYNEIHSTVLRIICNGIFLVNVCNNIHHPSIMNRVVTHELIHAFDHCRAHVDWFRNIKHLACSEIRAANLSGDCSFINEVRRFKFGFKQHRQACIRDGAIRSILAVRKVDRETAEKAVDEVFNSCFNDHEPYGRVPHNSKEAKYAYRDFQNRDRYYANL
uniref:Mitochondrial inner membrane protease ATP23 n=1 Tax=Sphenodon punctatus TaxID=8508 RepID=A0A8D0GWB9_SPHPU